MKVDILTKDSSLDRIPHVAAAQHEKKSIVCKIRQGLCYRGK